MSYVSISMMSLIWIFNFVKWFLTIFLQCSGAIFLYLILFTALFAKYINEDDDLEEFPEEDKEETGYQEETKPSNSVESKSNEMEKPKRLLDWSKDSEDGEYEKEAESYEKVEDVDNTSSSETVQSSPIKVLHNQEPTAPKQEIGFSKIEVGCNQEPVSVDISAEAQRILHTSQVVKNNWENIHKRLILLNARNEVDYELEEGSEYKEFKRECDEYLSMTKDIHDEASAQQAQDKLKEIRSKIPPMLSDDPSK